MPASPDDSFQDAFWGAKRAMTDAAELAFARHGVRAGQQFILKALWERDGLTPAEIAQQFDLALPTITKATTRMEAAGLVTRTPHPTDARRVQIFLTPRGRALRRTIAAERRRFTERALDGLSPAERAQLVAWLRRIRANLTGAAPEE